MIFFCKVRLLRKFVKKLGNGQNLKRKLKKDSLIILYVQYVKSFVDKKL